MLCLSGANNVFKRNGIERDLPRLMAPMQEFSYDGDEDFEYESRAEDREEDFEGAAADADENGSAEEENQD
ncbi:uncharacterized protein PHACADRAFT_266328 [Phanerochaete carnosa HHB-10118-sp]|uniref:Uncharacterized protein n=1 Tax=Phanerochaete carnosa (strain HHB-10118-sp) TaxID=650164 RepID=K5VPJ2_PHACS|nr:uncharacterized protein PHACADRAFT_266328 [Phanerochaete carnosa HHB-10118-sp]EKM48499.1 hypothetical protein PHACADRAFT_266328 [Phanerochaete carnosa HHB-10118-sp]